MSTHDNDIELINDDSEGAGGLNIGFECLISSLASSCSAPTLTRLIFSLYSQSLRGRRFDFAMKEFFLLDQLSGPKDTPKW